MNNELVERLERAVERLLEENSTLRRTCRQLESDNEQWRIEKANLLGQVEAVLTRLDEHLEDESP
ncbi:MAG: hypothetical protein C0618_10625 [Desulfuromonas sp.]|nr:MAG: hypothetical protein C0618_10625 [Desulfuromonas sp.]